MKIIDGKPVKPPYTCVLIIVFNGGLIQVRLTILEPNFNVPWIFEPIPPNFPSKLLDRIYLIIPCNYTLVLERNCMDV